MGNNSADGMGNLFPVAGYNLNLSSITGKTGKVSIHIFNMTSPFLYTGILCLTMSSALFYPAIVTSVLNLI